ncbi:hypothetical protein LEMLEM_LOCUS21805 [Lemmus lemmus]
MCGHFSKSHKTNRSRGFNSKSHGWKVTSLLDLSQSPETKN